MKFPTMFIIVTSFLAMSARWISSFSHHYGGLLVLPFKLLERFMLEIGRFLCGILLNMLFPVLKVSGLHTQFVKTIGVKQEQNMMNITVNCANILH
jgi:hypothetical protein